MRKLFIFFTMITVLIMAGCGSDGNNDENNDNNNNNNVTNADQQDENDNEENNPENNNVENNNEENNPENNNEENNNEENNENEDVAIDPDTEGKGELTLQMLKADEEDGVVMEENEIYSVIMDEVDADPYMGDADDLSLFPYDIVEFSDGSLSLLFLVINRLDKPIENLVFTLTLGDDEENYIFEDLLVDLPEEFLGVLEVDSTVPVLIDMEPDTVELFWSLTDDNVVMIVEDLGIDFVE